MLYRNLLAMETEELLRSYPVDGAVLMGGCDKTTPALLMGAIVDEPAGDLPARRADAARQLARHDARLRLRHLEVLGRTARRQHHRGGLAGDRGRHRALARALHDDGHGVDDDERGRGAGPDAAGRRVDSGAPTRATRGWPRHRPAHRRDGLGGPASRPDMLDAHAVRQRDHHGARARRLDQRDRPPDRDGAARRHRADARRLRRAVAPHAAARQHPAVGQVPDGGLLLRRRPARAAGATAAICSTPSRARSTARRSARTSPARRSSTTT